MIIKMIRLRERERDIDKICSKLTSYSSFYKKPANSFFIQCTQKDIFKVLKSSLVVIFDIYKTTMSWLSLAVNWMNIHKLL